MSRVVAVLEKLGSFYLQSVPERRMEFPGRTDEHYVVTCSGSLRCWPRIELLFSSRVGSRVVAVLEKLGSFCLQSVPERRLEFLGRTDEPYVVTCSGSLRCWPRIKLLFSRICDWGDYCSPYHLFSLLLDSLMRLASVRGPTVEASKAENQSLV